jgi:MSHA biogenesis protein MshP
MRRARGFALILAVFLIVSLAAIGAYLLTVSNVQLETAVMDEQGARAYQAAPAGVEWGAYQVLRNPGGAFASTCDGGSSSQSFAVPGIASFRSTVGCTSPGTETEDGVTVRAYRITATGCNSAVCPDPAPGATYVERQLQLILAR